MANHNKTHRVTFSKMGKASDWDDTSIVTVGGVEFGELVRDTIEDYTGSSVRMKTVGYTLFINADSDHDDALAAIGLHGVTSFTVKRFNSAPSALAAAKMAARAACKIINN